MKLIVGLGNPGKKYEKNIHNAGFIVINKYASKHQLSISSNKFNGMYVKTKILGEDVILAYPLTFMNLSGSFVFQIANYFNVMIDDILVIHDDVDIPINNFRYKLDGGHGGQNGIKDIIDQFKSGSFSRLRIGVKPIQELSSIKDYVLSNFSEDDLNNLSKDNNVYESIDEFIIGDFLSTANKYNSK